MKVCLLNMSPVNNSGLDVADSVKIAPGPALLELIVFVITGILTLF